MCDIILKEIVEVQYTSTQKPPASSERYFVWAFKSFDYLLVAIMAQIKQYSNLISLTADQLQDLKSRIKELDNDDCEQELNAINQAQSKLYQALKSLETD